MTLRPPILLLSAMLAASLSLSGCGSENKPTDPFRSATLDQAISDAMSAAGIPGAVVGAWSPEGEYVKAFGVADTAIGTPMKTDFFSRIGSVTKTFTATAVLQLVDEGKVRLDDPIAEYIEGVPNGAAITVRQLADMRSGLLDYTKTNGFIAAMTDNPEQEFSPQQLLAWSFTAPASSAPGQRVEYSNTNYILLGLLVEKVTGTPLSDYLTERIFNPLGLSDTSFPAGSHFPEPHAQGYTEPLNGDGPPVVASSWTTSFAWAAGAMVSTLEDLRTWVPALAGGSLLSPDLQRQRLRTAPEPGSPDDFGYGMGLFTIAGWIGHNGSVPGYQTVAVYLPEPRITLVVMINTDVAVPDGGDPSGVLATAITEVITPDHVYEF